MTNLWQELLEEVNDRDAYHVKTRHRHPVMPEVVEEVAPVVVAVEEEDDAEEAEAEEAVEVEAEVEEVEVVTPHLLRR